MIKKSFFLIFLCFLSFSLRELRASTEENFFFKTPLSRAQKGDYVVVLQHKSLSLLHIFETHPKTLIIEEVSAPAKIKSTIKGDWKKWIENDAPGHTAWVMYELNLETGSVEDIFSCAQKCWKKVFPQEQIFPTLFDLKFSLVPDEKRKKVGPPPPSEMIEERPIWQPPVFFEGKKVPNLSSKAYSAYWPNDGTDLSGKKINIFLAEGDPNIPDFFPVWMQVSDKIGRLKLRIIDSGQELTSPYKQFPVPPPSLSACHFTKEGHLQFHLRSHPTFTEYKVYARDLESPSSLLVPFKAEVQKGSRELRLTISNETLNNKFQLDKLYTFIFEPEGYIHLSIETPKPLKIIKKYAVK
ncbi:MAG: hypothetical protein S4CHLAM7_07490 [Chlamydiae bacterium]|nr:hypothetical protein [Chlamydiota bacterium]